jgi:hypothetical protein
MDGDNMNTRKFIKSLMAMAIAPLTLLNKSYPAVDGVRSLVHRKVWFCDASYSKKQYDYIVSIILHPTSSKIFKEFLKRKPLKS